METLRRVTKRKQPAEPVSPTAASEPEPTLSAEQLARRRREEIHRDEQLLRQHPDRINVAALRSGVDRRAVSVDHATRRGEHDVEQGHMACLNLDDPAVLEAVTTVHGGTLAPGQGQFGIYERPLELDDDGYPRTVLVKLRDSAAALVTVPYTALSPVPEGMRVR